MTPVDIAKVCIGTALLAYASIGDIRHRRVADGIWILMAAAAIILLPVSTVRVEDIPPAAMVIGISVSLRFLRVFGGADCKALIATVLLFPVRPDMPFLPVLPHGNYFPVTVLTNSLLIFLVFPAWFISRNICRGDISFPRMIMGYRISPSRLKKPFFIPLEKTGGTATGPVWASPSIPFVAIVSIAFIVSLVLGDIMLLLT